MHAATGRRWRRLRCGARLRAAHPCSCRRLGHRGCQPLGIPARRPCSVGGRGRRAHQRRHRQSGGLRPSSESCSMETTARSNEHCCAKAAFDDGSFLGECHAKDSEDSRSPKKFFPVPATRARSDYWFHVELALDCLEVKDVEGRRYTVFCVVCMGTLHHVAKTVSPTGGVFHRHGRA